MTTAVNPAQLDPLMGPSPDDGGDLAWISPRREPFHLAGFAWLAQDGVYRRLPVHPEWPIRPEVDRLADATAGGQIRFRTDSSAIAVRVTLAGPPNMNHMAATGQCGFDGYVGDCGDQHYAGTARPTLGSDRYEQIVFRTPSRQMRTITLDFPLYQGVTEVLVGLDPDAAIDAPPDYAGGRVVVYGTSITQGGCAARPGMAYTNILSRRIPREFVNLGFSGNGRGEPEVARVIAQLDGVDCFVLDYETNVPDLETLRTTLTDFIPILRERHPLVPILVLTKPQFVQEHYDPKKAAQRRERRDVQAGIVERYRNEGDANLHFLDMLDDGFDDCTVDGSHPTDLGFLRMADRLEPVVADLLS